MYYKYIQKDKRKFHIDFIEKIKLYFCKIF